MFDFVDIFSLNHDLLVERMLDGQHITFADGFGQDDGDARLFSWSWRGFNGPARLYKLHGSIDWYLIRFKSPVRDQFAKIRGDPDHAKDGSGQRLDPLNIVPNFLTGTTVKEQAYGIGLYGEIFEEFRHRMRECNTLICSGYGWSDKGINIRINQWLRDSASNRVVILHGPEGEDLAGKPFWYWRWEDYAKAEKVVHIPKWLGQCSMDDIAPHLSRS